MLGVRPRSLGSFVHVDAADGTDIVPLSTHGGLLLLRLNPRGGNLDPD
jgi:hypothetical protein